MIHSESVVEVISLEFSLSIVYLMGRKHSFEVKEGQNLCLRLFTDSWATTNNVNLRL